MLCTSTVQIAMNKFILAIGVAALAFAAHAQVTTTTNAVAGDGGLNTDGGSYTGGGGSSYGGSSGSYGGSSSSGKKGKKGNKQDKSKASTASLRSDNSDLGLDGIFNSLR